MLCLFGGDLPVRRVILCSSLTVNTGSSLRRPCFPGHAHWYLVLHSIAQAGCVGEVSSIGVPWNPTFWDEFCELDAFGAPSFNWASYVLPDYGVRGLGLLGWLPLPLWSTDELGYFIIDRLSNPYSRLSIGRTKEASAGRVGPDRLGDDSIGNLGRWATHEALGN